MKLIEVPEEKITLDFIKKNEVYIRIANDRYLSAVRRKEGIEIGKKYNRKFYVFKGEAE